MRAGDRAVCGACDRRSVAATPCPQTQETPPATLLTRHPPVCPVRRARVMRGTVAG